MQHGATAAGSLYNDTRVYDRVVWAMQGRSSIATSGHSTQGEHYHRERCMSWTRADNSRDTNLDEFMSYP